MSENFKQQLEAKWADGKFVCVGLDSDFSKIPLHLQGLGKREGLLAFNKGIVDATKDLVCAYKPNIAFYESLGEVGLEVLRETIVHIHSVAQGVPVILDAKRADIGSTNDQYVKMAFDFLGADAITIHPYLGEKAVEPFLKRADKGIIVLCRTSNPGAGEFQDLMVSDNGAQMPLYMYVATKVARDWNKNGNCALVVGATYPDELSNVRKIVGDMPILIPGIGAQGGDLEKTVTCGKFRNGCGMIINSARDIIFASNGVDFAEASRAKTQNLNEAIRALL